MQRGGPVLDGERLGVVHRRDRGGLRAAADRGDDPQTAGVEVGLGERAVGEQLAAHHRQQVAVRPRVGLLLLLRHRRRHHHRVALALGQRLAEHHAVEDVVEPIGGLLRVLRRVPSARVGDDPGQQGALLDREVGGVLAEVGLRRRLDAVRAAAEVDGVEVGGERLVLGLLLVDLQRDDGFLGLARVRLVERQVVVLDVLLGDRRAAAGVVPAHLAPHRPAEADRRDAAVLVEGAVLGGDDRVLDVLRDLLAADDGAVLGGEPAHLVLAVAVVDDRGLVVGEVVRLRDVDQPVRDVEPDQPERDEPEERAEDDLPGRQPAEPAAAPAGLPALAGGAGGRGGAAALATPLRGGSAAGAGGGAGRALRGTAAAGGRAVAAAVGHEVGLQVGDGRAAPSCVRHRTVCGPFPGTPGGAAVRVENLHRTSPVFPRMEARPPVGPADHAPTRR